MGIFKKKFRSIKKLPDWIFIPPAMMIKILKIFAFRTSIDDPHEHIKNTPSAVTVTWHNRLLFFAAMFPKKVRLNTCAVVSASRDGQYITDLVKQFGISSARGSTSRKGANAQREALKALNSGKHVSFTPDGPRGPKYTMSRGPIHLASISGKIIIPISINATRYWEIKSWDNFQIPKPFCRLTLTLGEGIKVPPDLDDVGLEQWRKTVEEKLMAITVDK